MNSVKEKTFQKLQSTLRSLPADQQNLIASIEEQLKEAIEAQIALVIAQQQGQRFVNTRVDSVEVELAETKHALTH